MTSAFAHIGVGFALSFIGSMPPGLINMSVAEATVSQGKRSATYIAIGAALTEGLQVLLAIKCAGWFIACPRIETFIHLAAIPVFLILGIYHLMKKSGQGNRQKSTAHYRDFFRGIFLSSLNFLAIPFWLFYGTWLGTKGWLMTDSLICLFFLGAFIGTVTLLFVYGWMSLKIVTHLEQAEQITNHLLAVLFLSLGLWQLFASI